MSRILGPSSQGLTFWVSKSKPSHFSQFDLQKISFVNGRKQGHSWQVILPFQADIYIILIFLYNRDNGISIQISIIQWSIEIVNQIVYVCFVLFLHGNSYFIDRLMGLYVISFTMIVQPAFYLNGDYKFRRDWDKKGPIRAIKSAVWDCE